MTDKKHFRTNIDTPSANQEARPSEAYSTPEIRINWLRRRFGMTNAQANLYVDLLFGGDSNV
jgi:hypothetical protein